MKRKTQNQFPDICNVSKNSFFMDSTGTRSIVPIINPSPKKSNYWIKESHDSDWDGVPNYRDCQPFNPRMQDDLLQDLKNLYSKSYHKGQVLGIESLKRKHGITDDMLDDLSMQMYKKRFWDCSEYQKIRVLHKLGAQFRDSYGQKSRIKVIKRMQKGKLKRMDKISDFLEPISWTNMKSTKHPEVYNYIKNKGAVRTSEIIRKFGKSGLHTMKWFMINEKCNVRYGNMGNVTGIDCGGKWY